MQRRRRVFSDTYDAWPATRRWYLVTVLGILAIVGLRLLPGYLFGGSGDQRGYVELWYLTEAHQNPYSEGPRIMAWPPLWWMMIGAMVELWGALGVDAWVENGYAARSFAIKLCYFACEIAGAAFLGLALLRERRQAVSTAPEASAMTAMYAVCFLLLPCTWVITALHGNFDVIPAFLTFAAFWLLQVRQDTTAAAGAALLLGLGMMARTIPGMFALPLAVEICRRHGRRWCLMSALLVLMPTVLSLFPLYLLAPDSALERVSGYRGNLEGWWGVGAIARLLVSDTAARLASEWNLRAFYPLYLALSVFCSVRLWQRRITVLTAGLLSVAGLFALAPTISNQNFYFLMPWAFWATVVERTPAARTFLWVVSLNLLLWYVVVPRNLDMPVWFHWTYSFPEASHLWPIPWPDWLARLLRSLASLRREGLDYNPFLQIMMRFPVWVALWIWFGRELRLSCTVRRSPLTRPGEEASLT